MYKLSKTSILSRSHGDFWYRAARWMQWYGIWCGCFIIFIFWVGFYLKWYGIWRGCIIFIFLVGISFKFYWQIISCALCGLCDMSCLHNWLKFSVVMTSMICSIQSLKDCCLHNWLKFSVAMWNEWWLFDSHLSVALRSMKFDWKLVCKSSGCHAEN